METKVNSSELFSDKKQRDARATELRAQGFVVSRRRHLNVLIHPQFLEDLRWKLRKEDCGPGNTIYKTRFAAIYEVKKLAAA